MTNPGKSAISVSPDSLPPPARSFSRKLRAFINSVSDPVFFTLWLVWLRVRYDEKIVIVCRPGALGDIICTLPLCGELRKRHPHATLVFLTHRHYQKMVLLSRAADQVYGAKSWTWPFSLSANYKIPGVVEAIYNPKTTDELSPQNGAPIHLIYDLAASCNITIPQPDRQPRLFPSPEFIQETQTVYGLTDDLAKGRLMIIINCGRTWPVRMWSATKWQELLDKIHADFDAVVLQFGLTMGKEDEYERLRGVRFLANRLKSDDLVALIAGCHLVISIDSGPIHVAGAVGVPIIGLFGAVNPHYRLPPDSPAVGVFSNVPCLYCHHQTPRGHWQTGCPNDIRCMKELEVQTVFDAVKDLSRKKPQINSFYAVAEQDSRHREVQSFTVDFP